MGIADRIAAVAGLVLQLLAVVAAVFGVAALGASLFYDSGMMFYGPGMILLLAFSGFGGAVLAFTFGTLLRMAAAGTVMSLDMDSESGLYIGKND